MAIYTRSVRCRFRSGAKPKELSRQAAGFGALVRRDTPCKRPTAAPAEGGSDLGNGLNDSPEFGDRHVAKMVVRAVMLPTHAAIHVGTHESHSGDSKSRERKMIRKGH